MPAEPSQRIEASLPETVAAIDLGSNSFHMIVARVNEGHLQAIDRIKEMVRLGEGLTENKLLRPEVAERALACLERFGQRLRGMPSGSVLAVGTNTLRQVRPETGFLEHAERALGHPIDVIAGREEARLIYLGVANGLAAGDERRLVVDIGGGSTELIVGEGFTPRLRESLHMGCVSMSRQQFPSGKITAKSMDRAELAGALEVRPVRELFRHSGWRNAVGSSGTIKAIAAVVAAQGWCQDGISADSLTNLRKALINFGNASDIDLKGLAEERKPVFAGGVAVLRSLFTNLGIEHIQVSDEALREGLIYEMMGRIRHEDVRERTVSSLSQRFGIDEDHAARVQTTALSLFGQVAQAWSLDNPNYPSILGWSARLFEIGLMVAHSQYQKHGAYLLRNADLSGFTRQEQAVLAALVLGHRRKFPVQEFLGLPRPVQDCARHLCVILRLAVLLHRGRSPTNKPHPMLSAIGERLRLDFPDDWLEQHPLTRLELEQEAERLKAAGLKLEFA
ncbi:MAG: exopolyphosphatase [Pseudomonadota bacterium]|nr:exopolyphosphatase [Pseudomonadota bacterium]